MGRWSKLQYEQKESILWSKYGGCTSYKGITGLRLLLVAFLLSVFYDCRKADNGYRV